MKADWATEEVSLTGEKEEAARKALCGLANRLNMTSGTVNGRVNRTELRCRRISLPTFCPIGISVVM